LQGTCYILRRDKRGEFFSLSSLVCQKGPPCGSFFGCPAKAPHIYLSETLKVKRYQYEFNTHGFKSLGKALKKLKIDLVA